MAEYIKRETVIELLHCNADESCASVVADFEALPAEDVVPVVHGSGCYCRKCMEFGRYTRKFEIYKHQEAQDNESD